MTDPIADLLNRIRTGSQARKQFVEVPWSRLKQALVEVLVAEGYLAGCAVVEQGGNKKKLRIELRYDAARRPVITGLRRVSRPGLRTYAGAKEVPRVRRGLGVSILSTSQGLLVDREARRRGIGGEVLCAVW